ncbi:MAG: hypothetical protein AABY14_00585 [Nanoarchaeota archaeon]
MVEIKKTKIKKKEWYEIMARGDMKNAFLGEVHLSEPSKMLGRCITVNLAQITNDSKHQHASLKFIINEVKDNKGLADVIGYEIGLSNVRRLVKKEKKKVELSFVCETADKVKLRIKPLMVIKKTTKGSTETALRKQTKDFLTKSIQKMQYHGLVSDMINNKLQEDVKAHLKKVYPLKNYDIRQMIVITPANRNVENSELMNEQGAKIESSKV